MNQNISLIIKPTNACNMRCKHCYHEESGYQGKKMTLALFEQILQKAIKNYDHISILWHGGEPLLMGLDFYRQALEIEKNLTQNSRIQIHNSLQTNALLMTDEFIQFFLENKFRIGVSFDGPFNDDLREQSTVVEQNIKQMQAHGLHFGCISVITAKSVSRLNELFDWASQNSINLQINPIFESGATKNNPQLLLNPQEYASAMAELFHRWLYSSPSVVHIANFEELIFKGRQSCSFGSCMYRWLAFDYKGDILPCGRPWGQQYSLGNISAYSEISEIFNSTPYTEIVRNAVNRRSECSKTCKYFSFCAGGCTSLSLLNANSDWECRATKHLLQAIEQDLTTIYTFSKQNSPCNKEYNSLLHHVLSMSPDMILEPYP